MLRLFGNYNFSRYLSVKRFIASHQSLRALPANDLTRDLFSGSLIFMVF
jgi:hypothetical protein